MATKRHSHSASSGDQNHSDEPPDYWLSVPFQDWSKSRMEDEIESFIVTTELEEYSDYIRRGALLCQDRNAFDRERPDGLKPKPSEQRYLDLEYSTRRGDKFRQAGRLWLLVALCSLGAAVQGWDESAVNGGEMNRKLFWFCVRGTDIAVSSNLLHV